MEIKKRETFRFIGKEIIKSICNTIIEFNSEGSFPFNSMTHKQRILYSCRWLVYVCIHTRNVVNETIKAPKGYEKWIKKKNETTINR